MEILQQKNGIEQLRRAGKDFLRFTFDGVLTQKEAIALCNVWRKYCYDQPDIRFIIVFNATKMINYEPQARIIFQKSIKELQDNVEKIWVVTDSKIILGGASIMSLVIGIPIRAVRSEEQIII
ncbi:MAG: hypothetical protein EBR30_10845 [Cytophagia bacterium]|nr:hypothetical protein [Cytophagia bacterium]